MPDRTATPEELLDQWLDALNEPGGATPPAPAAIADLAGVARDFRRALAPNGTVAVERNGKMHHAHRLASPNGATWRILAQPKRQKVTWSSWLATAAMIALLVGLVGGAAVRTWGLPGESDPTRVAGVAASPGATPAADTLSCAAPGYRPVVEGPVDAQSLAAIGVTEDPIVVGDDEVIVPQVGGGELTVPNGASVTFDRGIAVTYFDDGSSAVTRLSDGEQWQFPAVEAEGAFTYGNGRYYTAPTDETLTNWYVLDTLTGERTTTADILAEPFSGPLTIEQVPPGSRYLGQPQSSDDLSVFIVSFGQSITGAYPTGPNDITPGTLVIPGSLDDAYFEVVSPHSIVSPSGDYLASYNELIDVSTSETFTGASGDFSGYVNGPFIAFVDDEPTILAWVDDEVRSIHASTGDHDVVFEADGPIQSVGYDRDAGSLVIGTGQEGFEKWTWFDLNTGANLQLTQLDGYHLNMTSAIDTVRYLTGVADFMQPVEAEQEDGRIRYPIRALDMETGSVSAAATNTLPANRDFSGVYLPATAYGGFVATRDASGSVVVLVPGAEAPIALPKPASVDLAIEHMGLSNTPGGRCLMLNTSDAEFHWTHQTFVAPIEPAAAWTELDVRISGWVEIPDSNEPTTLPAQDFATPAAVAPESDLSCASPGYVPVVSGDVDAADLAVFGGPGNVIRSTEDGVVVPLPGGETRELQPDSFIYPGSDFALAVHDDNSATATRISTGETWEYPAVKPRVEEQNWDFFANGRYVVGPTDDSRTDWLITDTLTGDTRTTADILGEPFEGPLDLWTMSSSENGDLWLLQFMTLTFSDHDVTPPAEIVDAPGYLVIPGSLDDAWVSDSPVRAEPIDTVVSPEGTSFIVTQTVRDATTGERIDSGEDNLTYFGELIGYLDETTLLTWRADVVNTVDIHTAVATPVYTAEGGIQSVAWDREAGTLAIGSASRGPVTWALLDLDTGEATPLPELDGYQLANVSMFGPVGRVDGAAALIDPQDGGDISVRALDMRTGEVSDAVTTRTDARQDGAPSIPAWSTGHYVQTSDDSGTVSFIDATSGTAVALPVPEGVVAPDGGQLDISVVPGGDCATLTPHDASGNPAGNTWIAPIEPGATWTELPVAIEQWIETDALAEMSAAPQVDAADPATPAATPQSAVLSCASPGYRAVVRGPVDEADLALLGDDPIDVTGDTVTAANGTEIEFGADEEWSVFPSSGVILSGEGDGPELPTVTSLATGQSWTFPTTTEQVGSLSGSYLMIGPWLLGPTDVTATDWRVVNTGTGEARLTSDIFGAPFAGTSQMHVTGPWGGITDGSLLVGFSRVGTRSAVLVLPSADPGDAWALGEEHAEAGWTGMITSDGARIAYLHLDESGGATVRVLDGFTGEQLAEYPAPDAGGDILQPVGLSGDDSRMILRDNQRVWTVDLATGEIATVFDPEGQIHNFAFDPTTGTALASAGDDAFTWVDPATGAVKELNIPLPMRFPQPQFGWALIQTRDDFAVDYALLDMATGELVAEPVSAGRDENGTNAWITGDDDTGVFVVQAESGRMLVLDGPGGQAFELAAPETGSAGWSGIAIGVSPNAECLVYTEAGQGDEPGTSWVAPLEPGADWTELPFELAMWIEMPPAPEGTPEATGTPILTVTPLAAGPVVIEPIDADHTPAPIPTPSPPQAVEPVSADDSLAVVTVTPLATGAPVIEPLPPTPTPSPTAQPAVADLLPDDAIPVVGSDDPESVDRDVFGTVGGVGPDSPPGLTIPLRSGAPLELPDAIAIAQLPRVAAALVTNDDGSRLTIDLTSGDTLVDYLPTAVEGESWIGHYLLIPGQDGTIWRVIDLLTGEQTDTATLGGGPFDRAVTIVPMPSPIDAPRNVVVQFAFETSTGDLVPWQGLATDAGPPSGTLIIPGSLDDARFHDTTRFATIDTVDLMQPTIALSGGDRPLVAQVTRLANGRIVVEDAITGEAVASWESLRAPETTEVAIAGFGPDGTSLVAWLTSSVTGLPDQVIWIRWDGDEPEVEELEFEQDDIQEVIPTHGQTAFVAVRAELEAGTVEPPRAWKLLDLESGEMTLLPELDGMMVHRHIPGDPWVVFTTGELPLSSSTVIVDATTGEVAARLDDPDLGTATVRASSRDGGVLVVTGHTGDEQSTGYVLDAASGEAWQLAPPEGGQVWYGVSPDGSLLTASTDSGDGWIAPLEPAAKWTPLPEGRIVDWLVLSEAG